GPLRTRTRFAMIIALCTGALPRRKGGYTKCTEKQRFACRSGPLDGVSAALGLAAGAHIGDAGPQLLKPNGAGNDLVTDDIGRGAADAERLCDLERVVERLVDAVLVHAQLEVHSWQAQL